jgi:hypothetical protein
MAEALGRLSAELERSGTRLGPERTTARIGGAVVSGVLPLVGTAGTLAGPVAAGAGGLVPAGPVPAGAVVAGVFFVIGRGLAAPGTLVSAAPGTPVPAEPESVRAVVRDAPDETDGAETDGAEAGGAETGGADEACATRRCTGRRPAAVVNRPGTGCLSGRDATAERLGGLPGTVARGAPVPEDVQVAAAGQAPLAEGAASELSAIMSPGGATGRRNDGRGSVPGAAMPAMDRATTRPDGAPRRTTWLIVPDKDGFCHVASASPKLGAATPGESATVRLMGLDTAQARG